MPDGSPHDAVELDHQEAISGRSARRMGIFHLKVSSRCYINLKFEAKCRYSGRMWAGEGRRGHGVPMQGTAGEGGTLGRRGTIFAPTRGYRVRH